jgi:hypothetical protein
MRLYNVKGLATTRRDGFQHLEVRNDPPYEPTMDWFTHSSVVVEVDKGAISVPIDLDYPKSSFEATVCSTFLSTFPSFAYRCWTRTGASWDAELQQLGYVEAVSQISFEILEFVPPGRYRVDMGTP